MGTYCWTFTDEPDVMVMTTKNIVSNKKPILSVWHDAEDGMWQFLDGTDVNEEDAMMISLEEIVNIDDTVWKRQSENEYFLGYIQAVISGCRFFYTILYI